METTNCLIYFLDGTTASITASAKQSLRIERILKLVICSILV